MSKVYLTQCGAFTAKHGHDGTLSEAVHSHRFHYEITFYGPTNAEGYLIDFRALADTFKKELEGRLEGSDLGTFLPQPTTEALAVWMYTRIKERLPHLYSVKVSEEPDRWIEYRGEE